MIDRNNLLALIAVLAAFIVFCVIASSCSGRANEQETKNMQFCVTAGGSWDSGYNDCQLPGVPLDD